MTSSGGQPEEKMGDDNHNHTRGLDTEGLERGTRDVELQRSLQERIGQIQEQNKLLLSR